MASEMAVSIAAKWFKSGFSGTFDEAVAELVKYIDAEFLPSMQAQSARVEELAAICEAKDVEVERLIGSRNTLFQQRNAVQSSLDEMTAERNRLAARVAIAESGVAVVGGLLRLPVVPKSRRPAQ